MKNVGIVALFVTVLVASSVGPARAQSSPAQLVATEVAAFNAHNAKAVADYHSTSAHLVLFKTGKVLAAGRSAINAFFVASFAKNPKQHATLTKQIVMGSMVVNHYTVTNAGTLTELISVYDVENDLIANEWLIIP